MTSCCVVRRVLTFALTLALGVALWQAFGGRARVANDVPHPERGARVPPGQRGVAWMSAPREAEGSRTWLVINSTPATARRANARCEGCSVKMRVLFGENGVPVPGNGFSLSPSSYPLIEEATAAARAIVFTPATKGGRPVPVWANVTYDCGDDEFKPSAYRGLCTVTVDSTSARTWDGRPWPVVRLYE